MATLKQFANTQTTTLTTSSAETTIVTANPLTENLLTGLVVSCVTAAAAGTLTVRDATGASVAKLVIDFPSAVAVPAQPLTLMFDPPLKQDTKNTNWTIQSSSASNSFKVCAIFVTEE